MKGIITAIQRMSINDGPGIRTTVFLKGCNMRCKWCHNPETWSGRYELQYCESKCIHCFSCKKVCPADAVSIYDNRIEFDRLKCIVCGRCEAECYTGAVSVVGKEVSASEIMNELMTDNEYYKVSGGGITVSGGEPLLQNGFVAEIFKLCRHSGIHTAIETNMSIAWDKISSLIPWVDLWMCDLKMMDPVRHKAWTGIDNSAILENIRNLADSGAHLIVRTPVIPGVNDNAEDITSICRYLAGLGDNVTYEMLPFHRFGFDKFRSLSIMNEMEKCPDLDMEQYESLKKIPEKYKLKISVK